MDTKLVIFEYDVGHAMIVVGYLSLLYLALSGRKINVPGPYFLLVGLGSALSAYSMVQRNRPVHVLIMQSFIALSSLYIYFK